MTHHLSSLSLSRPTTERAPSGRASAPGRTPVLLRLTGSFDIDGSLALEHYIEAAHAETAPAIVVDLSQVTHLCPASARVLNRLARLQEATGRRLVLAAAPPHVVRILGRFAGEHAVVWADTLHHALAAIPPEPPEEVTALVSVPTGSGAEGPGTAGDAEDGRTPAALLDGEWEEREQLRRDVRGLRRKLRAHPVISRVQGTLVERYGLDSAEQAFQLLRTTSQRHNVKLRMLAAGVAGAPRPVPGSPSWFPGRRPTPPPAVRLGGAGGPVQHEHQPALLNALRDAAMSCAGTVLANVQLADPVDGALVLEAQHGFDDVFLDHFAVVQDGRSACGQAMFEGRRTVIGEVATDPVYDDESRRVMLGAGSRSVQSTPLIGDRGRCLGMFSTHYTRSRHRHTPAELTELDRLASESAVWLDWYRRTRLLDALEDLHHRASAPGS